MDEVHFQQHGSRCKMWFPADCKDPVLPHAPTRKSISYFGAVRIRDGKLVMSKPKGSFDAQTCWDFLKTLKKVSGRSGRKVIVIADNARYHHAAMHLGWREQHAENFELYFLPPYSPELNPIERVWKLLRRKCIHNRHFPTLEVLSEAIEPTLNEWRKPNEALRKLCSIA
jgi:transposase